MSLIVVHNQIKCIFDNIYEMSTFQTYPKGYIINEWFVYVSINYTNITFSCFNAQVRQIKMNSIIQIYYISATVYLV